MDAKITLSFDAEVINNSKQYAEKHGISLSRLTEILLRKLVSGQYGHIEEFPVADWVTMAAEGEAEYISRPRSNKKLRGAYRERK